MKRHRDALGIQGGACNPSGIAFSIIQACDEMRAMPDYAGTDQLTSDPAVRLMVHQLAYICGVPTCESTSDWCAWDKACEEAA